MKDKAWSVPDKRGIKDNLEPEVEERTILKTWKGDIIDITDDLKKLIEKLELEKKENRGLFTKIKNKLLRRPNGKQLEPEPEKRVILQTWDSDEVDITNILKKMIEKKRKKGKKK